MNAPHKKPEGTETVEDVILARVAKGERWRSALIAFYERDELRERAKGLKRGDPLDYLDFRTIEALEAAFIRMAVAA